MADYNTYGLWEGFQIPDTAKPYAGLSDEWKTYLSSALKGVQPAGENYAAAVNNLFGAPTLIEDTRQKMKTATETELAPMVDRVLGQKISDLGNRGVLSSSAANASMDELSRAVADQSATKGAEADVWAGNALLQNLKDAVDATGGSYNVLNNLLTRGNVQTDESVPYQLALQLIKLLSGV
jgi:hypothetical protein